MQGWAVDLVRSYKPRFVMLSPPCTFWSPLQNWNQHSWSKDKLDLSWTPLSILDGPRKASRALPETVDFVM